MAALIPNSYGDYIAYDENPEAEVIEEAKKSIAKNLINEMIDRGEDLNNFIFKDVVRLKPEYETISVAFKADFKKEKYTDEQRQALAKMRSELVIG